MISWSQAAVGYNVKLQDIFLPDTIKHIEELMLWDYREYKIVLQLA
jgi:hypothetical protein